MFKAAQKGNITAAQLASVFAKQEDRKSLSKNALDVDGINIDDDGNIIKPRKPYVAPEMTEKEPSASPEYLPEYEEAAAVLAPEASEEGTNEVVDDNPQDAVFKKLNTHL